MFPMVTFLIVLWLVLACFYLFYVYYKTKISLKDSSVVRDSFTRMFLLVLGIYTGFSSLWYGITRELPPLSDQEDMYLMMAFGGVMLIIFSIQSLIKDLKDLEKKKRK